MAERLFTPIIKNRDGARLWLCDGLDGENFRLNGEYSEGDIVAESNAVEGIGGVATRIAFRERSNGTQLNWSGIPFLGDVVDVTFPNGEKVDYSHDELAAWVTPRIEQNLIGETTFLQ